MGMGRIQSFDVASGTQTVPSIVALNNAWGEQWWL
jgi:hypothetical protein